MTKLGPYELNHIYTGDARELALAIPDNSIDLIFTDPVYQNIDDYRWLAEMAARVLKDGGSVVAQAGTLFRYDAETAMRKSSLQPRPLLSEICKGGGLLLFSERSIIRWKPWLWFSKNGPQWDWVHDAVYGTRDKSLHDWGDGTTAMSNWIGRLSNKTGLVLDPFCGGGTVPAACKMLGRNYLAFEIDPATADLARERVANTQPPLFVLEPEQLPLTPTSP